MQNNNNVHVFFASDERYLPYLSVAIKSLSDHASEAYIYNINILSEGFGEAELAPLRSIIKDNVIIKVHDVKEKISGLREHLGLRLRDYYSVSIYYRMFIPSMFEELPRAIYLDSDVVICDDVAKLYFTDIGDNLVGAVTDESVIVVPVFCDYVKRHIGVKSECDYFNSGVLLMNLTEMRRMGVEETFIKLLCKYNFNTVAPDQDYLNFLCRGRVCYLPCGWNKHAIPGRDIPDSELHIMHFNMFNKPWHYDGVPYEHKFWSVVPSTPFSDVIMRDKQAYGDAERARDMEGGKRLLDAAEDIFKNGQSMSEIASCEVFFPRVSAISDKLNKTKRGITYAGRRVKRRAAFGN